jgi:hypothetical protein
MARKPLLHRAGITSNPYCWGNGDKLLWLLAVNCQVSEVQHDVESPAPDHDNINAGQEFLEPVRFLLARTQKIEGVVWPS